MGKYDELNKYAAQGVQMRYDEDEKKSKRRASSSVPKSDPKPKKPVTKAKPAQPAKAAPANVFSFPAKDMKAAVIDGFKQLGVEVKLDPDPKLSEGGYKRGPCMTLGELRETPVGSIVWVRWKEYEEMQPRDDGPFRLNSKSPEGFGFENGSSFAHDLGVQDFKENKIGVADALSVDKCGVGLFEVFRAVKEK